MTSLWFDLRYALRQLRKNPGFAFLAVLTLALGIGANTTIFSWIDATLLDPIPGIRTTGQMITLMRGERSDHPTPPFSYYDYAELRDNTHSFAGLLAYHDDYMSITGTGTPERVYGALTSSNYFEVLGVRPQLGRTLAPTGANESAGAAEAVLSYELWQNRFGADQGVVGRTIQINLHPYTIVGVAPKGFHGCKSGLKSDIWIPLGMDSMIWGSTRLMQRDTYWLNVLGKLRPGIDSAAADSELNVLMQHIVDRYPNEHRGPNRISSDPLWRSPFGANVYLAGTLPILLALAAVLLLLACANVANLLLVRTVARRRELAIRLSMGASRWRILRQLCFENLLLALAGGAVALLLTMWTAGGLAAFMHSELLPLALNGHLDAKVFLAALSMAVVAALLAGIAPALRAVQLSPATVLKDEALSTSGGSSRHRLTGALVVVQVALSLLLLTCAGLFIRTLRNAQQIDPGFDSSHVLVASFDLDPLGYRAATGKEFDRQLINRVQSLPGVQSAAVADFSPLNFSLHSDYVQAEGYIPQVHESMEIDRATATPGFLKTLRTPLLAGRDFTPADNETALPVAIVNQAFVDRYWHGQSGIGKRLSLYGKWYTVVGVAANAKYRRLTYSTAPLFMVPLMQRYGGLVTLHVRTTGDPMAIASNVEQILHGLNPDLPVYNISTLETNMQMGSVFERLAVTLAGSFGGVALLLSAIGIYGVVSYSTRQRTHEIGIRIALGAEQGVLFRQILAQGLRLTVLGLAIGIAVSLLLTRFLRGLLFGVGATDWITLSAVAGILCAVSLAACYMPAWKASRIHPVEALRTE